MYCPRCACRLERTIEARTAILAGATGHLEQVLNHYTFEPRVQPFEKEITLL